MKILILDDIEHRHNVFQKSYYGDGYVTFHAYTYGEFCKLLEDSPWDLIHLDHDLGDFVDNADTYYDGWGNKVEYNGGHASMRICELPDDKLPGRVIIHSVNPVGSRVMQSNLERRGIPVVWEPFGDIG